MKLGIIFTIVGITYANGRLRRFRQYHKSVANARKVPAGRPELGRGQKRSKTLNRLCSATTCSKCEKLVLGGGRKKFCLILLNLKDCCARNHVRGGF